jgi:hypothetical protein
MLFPFVILFLAVALSDVMTWFFYSTCKYDEIRRARTTSRSEEEAGGWGVAKTTSEEDK